MPNHILLNSLNFFPYLFIFLILIRLHMTGYVVYGGARILCWECNTQSVPLYVVLLVYLCTSRWYNTLARFINATQFIEFIRIERLALNLTLFAFYFIQQILSFFPFDFVHSVFFWCFVFFNILHFGRKKDTFVIFFIRLRVIAFIVKRKSETIH